MIIVRIGRKARRAATGTAALALALLATVSTTGTAYAYTAWPDVILIPRSNGNVCYNQDWGVSIPNLQANAACSVGTRPAPKGMQWQVQSAAPDDGAISNVKVKNLWSGDCLTAVNESGTWRVKVLGCDPSRNSGQLWALTYSSGTQAWQFYNYSSHRCLDAGQTNTWLYYSASGCNTTNRYQSWWSANA